MTGRTKRARTGRLIRPAVAGGESPQSAAIGSRSSAGGDSSHGFSYPVDPSSFDCGSFASRCSARLINEVVSKFDIVKRELLNSIGFRSILEFPVFKQFNRKFSLWLLSSVDEKTSSLIIGDHISISFSKYDVAHVFGIPASGKSILDARVSSREAREKVLNDLLPHDFKESRSIKSAQEVIERHYEYPMSKTEADRFRVAFVVFVASNLLAPSSKYDYACIDYWNAIQDPDSIGAFDWSEFVITRLLEGAAKLKQDISSNIKFPNITGCSIFLQVLYLDSIYIEGLSKPHTSFPRVVDFSYDKIGPMIQADRNYAIYLKEQIGPPFTKLRDPYKCVYSWAYAHRFGNEVGSDCSLLAIWEAAVAMVHLLKIPLEAAGPIFVALADFQEQINLGLVVNGMHAMKVISVVVSIMIPYARGFSYHSSYGVESTNDGHDAVGSTISNGTRRLSSISNGNRRRIDKPGNCHIGGAKKSCHVGRGDLSQSSGASVMASLDDTPHNLNINLRVATAMSQFYAQLRKFKPARDFDLNYMSSEVTSSSEVSSILSFDLSERLLSPWDLGYYWGLHDVPTAAVIGMLNSIEVDDSLVIVHRKPKDIQVSLRALRDQLLGKSEVEVDFMDALIRNVVQEDDDMYQSSGTCRWRIYFESDIMDRIWTGSFDLVDPNIQSNLCLSSSSVDLSKSKLVFFPAMLQCSWVCFTWNLDDNLLYVFEPSFIPPVPEYRVEAIERSAYLLKLALQTLSRYVFRGVDIDATCAEVRIITLPITGLNRSNRSGVLCSLFLRCFDGNDLFPKIEVIDVEAVAAKLLRHIVKLKNNLGLIPNILFDQI